MKKSVWVVKGCEGCDSSGGVVTLLIVTDTLTADVEESYHRTRQRDGCELYEVSEIRLLGTFEAEGLLLVDADD